MRLNNWIIYLFIYFIEANWSFHFESLTAISNGLEYIMRIESNYRSNYIIKIILPTILQFDIMIISMISYCMLIFGSTTTFKAGHCGRIDSTNFDNLILIVTSTAGNHNLGVTALYLKSLTVKNQKESDMISIKH